MVKLDSVQDAFVGKEVVVHLAPGKKWDDKGIRDVLKKHKVTVKGKASESGDQIWKQMSKKGA